MIFNKDLDEMLNEYRNLLIDVTKESKKYREIIEKQDETIRTLMGNWKDNREFECVAFVPYRGKPVVIKDGKVVSNENMTSFDVGWAWDSKTEVTVNNE